jgi:hypothetical protein
VKVKAHPPDGGLEAGRGILQVESNSWSLLAMHGQTLPVTVSFTRRSEGMTCFPYIPTTCGVDYLTYVESVVNSCYQG